MAKPFRYGFLPFVLILGLGCSADTVAFPTTDAAGLDAAAVADTVDASGVDDVPAVDVSVVDLTEEDAEVAEEVDTAPSEPKHVLIFTKTVGYRHGSIEVGAERLTKLAAELGLTSSRSEDAGEISSEGLADVDVLVFLSTTGDILDATQQAAMESWVASGGTWIGIHAAADCEYDWPWYGGLVGAWFDKHPSPQLATLHIPDTGHPATAHLGPTWSRTDEWYDFRTDPSGEVTVLAWLDESTYSGGTMGDSHPIAWTRDYAGGRMFYTAGGHTDESYSEPEFVQHLKGALSWAVSAPRR